MQGIWGKFRNGWTRGSMLALNNNEFRLWCHGHDHCCSEATEGLIPRWMLGALSAGKVSAPAKAAEGLVAKGKWHDENGYALCESEYCTKAPAPGPENWLIHEFLEFNKSRDELAAMKEADAKRHAAWREKKAAEKAAEAKTKADVTALPTADTPCDKRVDNGVRDVTGRDGSTSRAALADEPVVENPDFESQLASLADVLTHDQRYNLGKIAEVNPRFASLKPGHLRRIKAERGVRGLTETLQIIRASDDAILAAVKTPAAYLDEVLSRLYPRETTPKASEQ